jgi:N-hydroxyarylamine O-acetyltransferase
MNTAAYLQRINYHGSLEPTARTLRELQLAHLLTVPFENLSIHWKQPIVLDDDSLFGKIVVRRRGGFCYELNGLFAGLLRSLGFNVEMLSAGVSHEDGGFGPDFDHMTLMVTLENRWLADVGFGDSFLEPLLLDSRDEQVQGARSYTIVPDGDNLVLKRREGLILEQGEGSTIQPGEGKGEWKNQYRFNLEPKELSDYEDMCLYHQTSPQSHFTQSRICSRTTHDGRLTLSDMRFITTVGPDRQERVLSTEEEYAIVLDESFGITQ